MAELRLVTDDAVTVVLSRRAYVAILCEVSERAPVETGGLLLGAWRNGCCYVVESIDPGPNSVFQLAYFEYDRPYTEHLINKVARLYEAPLTLVGLWHRHPGSFDQFSGTDDTTNAKFAALSPEGAISGLVNVDPDFRLKFFHARLPLRYEVVKFEVGDELIPTDLLAYRDEGILLDYLRAQALGNTDGPTRGPQVHEVPGMRLEDIMGRCCERLRELDLDELTESSLDEADDSWDQLVEVTVDDLLWLGNELGVHVEATRYASKMVVTEKDLEDARQIIVMRMNNKPVLEYDGRRYRYGAGFLKMAYTDQDPSPSPDDEAPSRELPKERARTSVIRSGATRDSSIVGILKNKLRI